MKYLVLILTNIMLVVLPVTVFALPAEDVEIINDRDYYPKVHKMLQEAKESIYVIMYLARYYDKYANSPTNVLLRDLAGSKAKGLKVNVVLDQGAPALGRSKVQNLENERVVEFLKKNKIPYQLDSPKTTTHSKLIIIDGLYTIIGSTNWSYSAMEKNHETAVIIKSKQVAEAYLQYFRTIK